MDGFPGPALTRRTFLDSAAGSAAAGFLPWLPRAAVSATPDSVELTLRPAPGRVRLVPETWAETPAWCFKDQVPGLEIRLR